MKKIIIFIVTMVIILCGCIDHGENNVNYYEKIIGKWIVGNMSEGEEDSVIFHFFTNNSFYINLTEIDNQGKNNIKTSWMKYEIKENNIIMDIDGNKVPLEFSFSENNNILTLKEKGGSSTILNKI